MSTTHRRFVPPSELLADGDAPAHGPSPMVRRGQLGTYYPPAGDNPAEFVPAPRPVQVMWAAVQGITDARRHLAHVAQHDPAVEPF